MQFSDVIMFVLSHFSLSMFVLALIFILINAAISKHRTPTFEIIYKWIAFFSVGITGIYTFIMHVYFPALAASTIDWLPSPFQFEVGIANLAFGILGLFSVGANYSFRLATVIGVTVWLWGDAYGHVQQILEKQNFSSGNAGTWFWLDIMVPLLLILCLLKMRRVRRW